MKKYSLSIYVRLHIFSPALTGGYTGKAKSCIGAWVPTVSIHKPLCFKKKFMLNVYKKLNVCCGEKGERPCEIEMGGM
jgi:hypothetical protein